MISALLALLAEPSRVRRLAFVAPMAVLVSSGSFRDALPLAIAAGAAGIPARKDLRLALLAAGACACLLAGGLPGAYGTDASPWVARSVARGEGACWPDTVTLDHSAPVLLLDLSPVEGMEVELHASGGGVRDGDPVGRLELPGGTRWDIPPRDTSFTFVAPRGTARVVLSRAWRPFEHPVVRFCSARTTGGGR